ncbi:heme A synthase [Aciditerrimonas ferrireducens]|uniref:Heme A synthase n=1 Tax=Aciditerrimonas ferrireducens TaxID=667306 RepID=A0ABV6BZW6_9ACTN
MARDTGGVRLLRVSPTTYRRLSLAAVVAIVGLVATGGWVRVSESGLGCPTWPKCTGASIVAPASSYHAWVEFSNRCLITAIGVLIAVLVVTALAARPRRRELVVLSLGLAVGYVGEAVLGGITVLAKLNPALVASHLVLALLLLSDAVALHWLASTPGPLARGRFGLPELRPRVGRGVVLGSRLLALCFWVTVVLGTVVTGTGPYSGQHGTPRFGFTILSTVLVHGGSGLVFGGVMLATLVLLGATGAPRDVQRRLWVAAGLLGAQGALGASVYFTHFRAGIIEAHVIGAAVLLVALFRYSLGLYEPVPAPVPTPQTAEPAEAWAPAPLGGLSPAGLLGGGRSEATPVEPPSAP